jgi:DNA-directed RNA polymerase specialized sigma24 family protein
VSGSPNRPEDDAILRGLHGTDDEKAAAVNATDARYGRRVCGALRRKFPSFSAHDLIEIWDDTLLALLERAATNQLDADGSLSALLHQIAFRRAIDRLRRRSRWGDVWHQVEDVLETIAARIQADPVAFDELLQSIGQKIERLPAPQRMVWEEYARLGFEASLAELTEAVRRRAGAPIDQPLVRKRLENGRNALRQSLQGTFRAWFGEPFDDWLEQWFVEWFERKYKRRRPDDGDADDEEPIDGQAEQ